MSCSKLTAQMNVKMRIESFQSVVAEEIKRSDELFLTSFSFRSIISFAVLLSLLLFLFFSHSRIMI